MEDLIVSKQINASPEKIWTALTDKTEMKKWYFDIPNFELKEGAEFSFDAGSDEVSYHHRGEILEVIPNRKLSHTWFYPDFSDEKSTVIWELSPNENGTLVTLTHQNIDAFMDLGKDFQRESFSAGWNGILGNSLKNFVKNN